jgi:hypothetical protein
MRGLKINMLRSDAQELCESVVEVVANELVLLLLVNQLICKRDKKGGLALRHPHQSQPEQRDPSHSVQVVLLKRAAKNGKKLCMVRTKV